MRRAEALRRAVLGSLALVCSIGLLMGWVRPAAAAPVDAADTEELALQVAEANCANFTLGGLTLPGDLDPKKVCERSVATLVNPANSQNVRSTCEAVLTPLKKNKLLFDRGAQLCTSAVEKVVGPARAMFERQQKRLASALERVDCAMSEGLGCITKQFQAWMADGLGRLWSEVVGSLTGKSFALSVIDIRSSNTNPTASQRSFYDFYGAMGTLALIVVGVMFVITLLTGLVRLSFRPIRDGLFGAVLWGVGWFAGVALAVLLVAASDGAAQILAGSTNAQGQNRLDKGSENFSGWIAYVSTIDQKLGVPKGVLPPSWEPGSVFAVVLVLVLLAAVFLINLVLFFRSIAIILITAALPLLLAFQAGPKMFRDILPRAAAALIAVCFAKPLMVALLILGTGLAKVPEPGADPMDLGGAIAGAAILLAGIFVPTIAYKLMVPGLSNAGERVGSGAGTIEQGASTVTTLSRNLDSVMTANKPAPLGPTGAPAKSSSTGAYTGGGAGSAAARSGAQKASGSAALSGTGLLAIQSAALAAGAGRMVTQWSAGQVATAGGALGDAEGAHAPQVPHLYPSQGGRGASASAPSQGTGGDQGRQPQAPAAPASGPQAAPQQQSGPASSPGRQTPPPPAAPPLRKD